MITDVKDLTSFKWGTIASLNPVRVILDGDSAPLALTPDSLVDPATFILGDRARVELTQRKVVIHGVSSSQGHTGIVTSITIAGVTLKKKDGSVVGPFRPASNYLPIPGDTAWTAMAGGEVVVAGAKDDTWKPPQDTSLWLSYAAGTGGANDWAYPHVTFRNGFVLMGGLLGAKTGLGSLDGRVLFTLPPEMRPDTSMMFLADNSGVGRTVTVEADGRVRLGANHTAGGYVSLSNIAFPVKGRAQWNIVPSSAFKNGWAPYSVSDFGQPRWWKDEYGIVWMAGLVAGGNTANGTAMFDMPAASWSSPSRVQHIATTASWILGGLYPPYSSAWGFVHYKTTPGTPNTLFSLATHYVSADGWASNPWQVGNAEFYMNGGSWVHYDTNVYPPMAYVQRGDGMVLFSGLVRSGGFGSGSPFFWVPDTMTKRRSTLYTTLSADNYGRLDMMGERKGGGNTTELQKVFPVNGATQWFSLDGVAYFPTLNN